MRISACGARGQEITRPAATSAAARSRMRLIDNVHHRTGVRSLLPNGAEADIPQLLVQGRNVLREQVVGARLEGGPGRDRRLEQVQRRLIDARNVALRLVDQKQVAGR